MHSDYRPMRLDEIDDRLQKEIKDNCGVDVEKCMECGKCSGGCSNGHVFDFTPRKVIQLIKLNDEETLFNMDATWICLSCHLCADRCPSGIDTPRILDYLREKAHRKGVAASRPNVKLFYEIMLSSVQRTGRISEFPLVLKYNLKSGHLMRDAGLGLKMFLKGKLHLWSSGVRGRREVRRLFDKNCLKGGVK